MTFSQLSLFYRQIYAFISVLLCRMSQQI